MSRVFLCKEVKCLKNVVNAYWKSLPRNFTNAVARSLGYLVNVNPAKNFVNLKKYTRKSVKNAERTFCTKIIIGNYASLAFLEHLFSRKSVMNLHCYANLRHNLVITIPDITEDP